MGIFRKFISRQTWLLIILAGILQVQAAQAVACDLMMTMPETAGENCNKHLAQAQQENTSDKTCCDMDHDYMADSGDCNDSNLAVNSYLSGKLNPEVVYSLISYVLHDQFIVTQSGLISASPARHSVYPGNHTYLTTQRLRI